MTDLEPELGPCPVKPGSVLRGKYHVIEQLATGTRGFIFAAEFQKDKAAVGPRQKVILKVSDSEHEFRNELWLTRKKFHEFVGSPFVHEVFPLAKQPWCVCVMERLGPNLCTAWKGYSNDESKCRECFQGLLERLQEAHGLHLAHLDIKPLNICETPDMQSWRLVDWGDAENMALIEHNGGAEQRGAVCYMSPEMMSGQEWDFTTDLWSAGVVLLEVFLGQVWDEEHWQLFDWPDQCGEEVLDQMERILGRLPDRMRGNRPEIEESLYGKPNALFSRCPALLADLLRHLLKYEPAQRASASDALKHIWFAVPDPTATNLSAWLEPTFAKWHSTWAVSDVERTSVDQALALLCANGDHEVADGWAQALVDSEFVLSAETFGTLIEAQLIKGVYKRAKRWLDFTCASHMDMGEEMILRLVQAAGAQYQHVVTSLEDADLPIAPRVFTFMAAIAPEQFRLAEIERILADMLKRGFVPENDFITLLFEEYLEEARANNGHHPNRKKQSIAHYLRGTAHHKPNKNANTPLMNRAALAIRRILAIEPLPRIDMPTLQAMYRALGERSEEFLHRDPWLHERLSDVQMRIQQDDRQKRERERRKEEAIQARQEELRRRKEEQQLLAVMRASSAARASKTVPRNRQCSQRRARAGGQCLQRRSHSLTSLRPANKVSPWR